MWLMIPKYDQGLSFAMSWRTIGVKNRMVASWWRRLKVYVFVLEEIKACVMGIGDPKSTIMAFTSLFLSMTFHGSTQVIVSVPSHPCPMPKPTFDVSFSLPMSFGRRKSMRRLRNASNITYEVILGLFLPPVY